MNRHLPAEEIDRLLEGGLSGEQSVKAEVHLRSCPACRHKRKRWEEFHRDLFALPPEPALDGLGSRTLRAVEQYRREQRIWKWIMAGSLSGGLGGMVLLVLDNGGPLSGWLQALQWPDFNQIWQAAVHFYDSPWTMTSDSVIRSLDGLLAMVGQSDAGVAAGLILLTLAAVAGTARLLTGSKEVSRPAS